MTKRDSYGLFIFDEPKPAKHCWTHITFHILMVVGCSLLAIQAIAQDRSWPENILQKSFDIHSQAQIDAPLDEVYQGFPGGTAYRL